ncbi:MAG: DUF4126 domain-containing protein [Bryobacteraceae bacterium]
MELLQTLGSALGLGFLSGFRLYATVLALGLAIRYNLFHLSQSMSSLGVLADWKVLAAAGAACAIEFFADKVPWLDSAWDSVHTIIRPVAATVLAGTALGDMDPVFKTILALMAGSVAFTAHSTKAATRLAINHSPEPFTNVAMSLAEDVAAPVGLWLVWQHPVWFLGALAVFLGAFFAFAPRIWRQIRLEMAALGALLGKWLGAGPDVRVQAPEQARDGGPVSALWGQVRDLVDELPENLAAGAGVATGVRCAATKSVGGLRRSLGYLCFAGGNLVFVTRRWFRTRTRTIALDDIRNSRRTNGLFLDQLIISTASSGDVTFDLLKAAPNRAAAMVADLTGAERA